MVILEINYTNYSEETLADRKIKKTIIEAALFNPDEVFDGRTGRKIAHKLVGDKLLRVIYEFDNKAYIVITAYYTKPERYTK